MFPKYSQKGIRSGSILFTNSLSPFSFCVMGYEIAFKSLNTNIPTHCEIFFRDLGIISAEFPTVRIIPPKKDYKYIAINHRLSKDELQYWKLKLLERVGALYDLVSFIKFIPDELLNALNLDIKIREKIKNFPSIGYNCVSLFRDLVPFDVEGLTVREFMLELGKNGWKIYSFDKKLSSNLNVINIKHDE